MFGSNNAEENKDNAATQTGAENAGTENTGVENTEAENTGDNTTTTAAEEAAANKPAEEAALDHAAAKASGTDVAGENVEHETSTAVYFEGRKVVRVLPADEQGNANKEFVRCEMSDATIVDVPRELFSDEDLEAADKEEDKAE